MVTKFFLLSSDTSLLSNGNRIFLVTQKGMGGSAWNGNKNKGKGKKKEEEEWKKKEKNAIKTKRKY